MVRVLVSDSSVLIEFSKRGLLEEMFRLPFEFAVPDLLFEEELIDLGTYSRDDLHRFGLRVEALDPLGVTTAGRGNWVSGLWPTPTVSDHKGSGPTVVRKDGKIRDDRLDYAVEQFWPTPSSQEPGWKNIEVVDRYGRPPTHLNQRFYDKKTGRLVQKGLEQTTQMFPTPDVGAAKGRGQASAAKCHRLGGTLNPRWVAWLMGYPPEYFDSVPWETPSSRRSRNK
jgi:hypothetical protein|tara:strand:- start:321 stop:995 length:675 start_codon:yes stop_codon:yes gene_type:complete